MAFVGHPILADIRKGFRLRPTQTVDKSKPIIQAEGEQLPELLQNRSPSPAPPPQTKDDGVPKATTAPAMTQANDAKSQQMNMAKSSRRNIGGQPASADHRQKMLAQIRAGGVRLRHVQTVDKSGLILDEQQHRILGTRNGAASPQSLDSQGKSPSPRNTPSSSSASTFSPTPISGDNSGGCWHRTLSDDSSDSLLLGNRCIAAAHNQLNHRHILPADHHVPKCYSAADHPLKNHRIADHSLDHNHQQPHRQQQQNRHPPPPLAPHPQHCSPPPPLTFLTPSNVATGRVPSPTLPTKRNQQGQGATIIRVDGTVSRGNGRNDQPQPTKSKSDFQFDEQQQIVERQEEVASLCAQRSASAKIVAFRKLQQWHQQQTESVASSYCTLPRKAKAQPKHWHATVTSSKDGADSMPAARAHFAVPTITNGTSERHGVYARRAQSPADWHDQKWPQASTTSKIEKVPQHHSFHEQPNANTLPNSKLRWRSPSPQRRIEALPPLLHRSVSSSLAHFSLAEPSALSQPSTNFRPFGQRVPGGGAHRQHFERLREQFEDAEKRNGTGRSAEVLWKRAAEERKGGGEGGGKANFGVNVAVATVFVNGAHFGLSDGREQPKKGQPPPLPTSSPPQIPHKARPSPITAPPSPRPPREIIRLKTPTNGIDLRHLQDLDGSQLAVLRADFKFAVDLNGDGDGKRLIRIVRR